MKEPDDFIDFDDDDEPETWEKILFAFIVVGVCLLAWWVLASVLA